jgi:serine/threonine-protein kinase
MGLPAPTAALGRRFEQAWRSGQRPQIELLLQEAPPAERPALFRELLAVEWTWRCRQGETPSVEEYLGRFPDQHETITAWYAEQGLPTEDEQTLDEPRRQPIDALLEVLRRCALLNARQRDEFQRTVLPQFREPQSLLTELVRRTWLTRYQADLLRQGRPRDLKIGPYLLLDRLGRGGMGQVFKARHRIMDRLVALKVVLPEQLDNPQLVQRFVREVQAAARLSHPNIVTVYDANQVQGRHYLAMELIDGTDLAQWIAGQGQAPIVQACDYVRQTALGLQHAHERGLVHRDIKPNNLMRTADQVVKILDLGLALRSAGTTLTNQEGSMLGTVDYMAPEQVSNAHAVDRRADVYSLGCTLYHFLAGRPPFADVHPAARPGSHQAQEPPPVESFRSDLPAGLVAVVRRMMAKKPEQRFQTAAEVAAALEQFTAAPSAVQPPPTVTEPTPTATPTAIEPTRVTPRRQQPVAAGNRPVRHVRRAQAVGQAAQPVAPEPGPGRTLLWLALAGLAVCLAGGGVGVKLLLDRPSHTESPSQAVREPDNPVAAVSPSGDDAASWLRAGNHCLERKEYDQAIAAFTKAIERDRTCAEAYYYRGLAHEAKGDRISAQSDQRTAFGLKPSLRDR